MVPQTSTGNGSVLEAEGLSCMRNRRPLFSGLGFRVQSGSALQIDGPNGSGKTTLLRILCGLTLFDDGAVRWCGRALDEVREDFMGQLAYVGHANGLKEELTALENLRFARALKPDTAGLPPREALGVMGLGPLAHTPCRKLSAGQRRRVALARCLTTGARVWVLDEPFTALDHGAVKGLEAQFARHLNDGGLLVLTSHHPVDLGDADVERVRLG